MNIDDLGLRGLAGDPDDLEATLFPERSDRLPVALGEGASAEVVGRDAIDRELVGWRDR